MSGKTYYELLDVEPTATAKEITRAWRRVSQKYHPDTVENMAPEFKELAGELQKEINNAHDELRDPQKRAEYDRKLGHRRSAEEGQWRAEEAQQRREEERRREEQRQAEEARRRREAEERAAEERRRREEENQQRAEEEQRRREAEAQAAQERRRREEESRQRENRHSRMGIASFVLSLLVIIVLLLDLLWVLLEAGNAF